MLHKNKSVRNGWLRGLLVVAVLAGVGSGFLLNRTASAETVTSSVSSSDDDAYHTTGGWPGYVTTGVVLAGQPGSNGPTVGGYRWTNLSIPAGANITSAYVEMTQTDWGSTNVPTTLSLYDTPNPSSFTSTDSPATRWNSRTNFEQQWIWVRETPNTHHHSPPLVDGIQELVDAYGAIDSVVLLQHGEGGAAGQYYNVGSFDTGNPAILHIEYEPGTSDPGVFAVNVTSDSADALPGDGLCADSVGQCSLRAAIEESNALTGPNEILFNQALDGSTINIVSGQLILDDDETTINGVGRDITVSGGGFLVNSSQNVISGLFITGANTGITVLGNENLIGGSSDDGEGNVISGNTFAGVSVPVGFNNRVTGNLIGTDRTGTSALPNGVGIGLAQASDPLVIGGTEPGLRNVISGNSSHGIQSGNPFGQTVVLGNFIGVDITGSAALPNGGDGINVTSGSVIIGGVSPGSGNVISGNAGNGIYKDNYQGGETIQGNLIGTDATGTSAIPNGGNGIHLTGSSSGLTGGGSTAARNIMSGNALNGLLIDSYGDVETGWGETVQGNFIGTDISGSSAVPNGMHGILITGQANGNLIGGTDPLTRNLISGNDRNGIFVDSIGRTSPIRVGPGQVSDNFIGTDATGQTAIPNGQGGIYVYATDVTVRDNLISGNTGYGAALGGENSVLAGNLIGTDATGLNALPNNGYGVYLPDFSSSQINNGAMIGGSIGTTPGGACTGDCNLVSGNTAGGIVSAGESAGGYFIVGNYVGTDITGSAAIGNDVGGMIVCCNTTIGGDTPEERNVISGNLGNGIQTGPHGGPAIRGNFIGSDSTGNFAIPNLGDGINSALTAAIGGVNPGEGNLISGNGGHGIAVGCIGGVTPDTPIFGNVIGLNYSGTTAVGNGRSGIAICYADGLLIGSAQTGGGNVISGNLRQGIYVGFDGPYGGGGFKNVRIENNLIGLAADGVTAIGNQADGIYVSGLTTQQGWGTLSVGDATKPDSANQIAFNNGPGIGVSEGHARVESNGIFSNAGLGIDLGYDGPTPNDSNDADLGPSNGQNSPDINGVSIQPDGYVYVDYEVDSSATYSNYPLTVQFFVADSDGEEGQMLLGTDVYDAANAQATKSANIGNATVLGIDGTEQIVATATDADGNTSEFSTAWAPNLPPVWNTVPLFTIPENAAAGSLVGVITAIDPESQPLTYSERFPASGTSALAIDPFTGAITVEDNSILDREILSEINYDVEVSDGVNVVGITFRLELSGINDNAPVANSQSASTDTGTPVVLTLTGSDADVDPSNSLTFSITGGPANGSLSAITPLSSTTAQVTYTPALGFDGLDSFTFLVNDGQTSSLDATVTITVEQVVLGLEPRSGHTATLLPGGQVLIIGGTDANGNVLGTILLYDPITGDSEVVGTLETPRTGHTATLLSDGSVVIIGGTDASGVAVGSVEVFVPPS